MELMRQIFTLREALAIIFRHKYKILIIFSATVAITTAHTLSLPKIYQANSSVLVEFGREYMYRSEIGRKQDDISWIGYSRESAINTDIKVLKSQELMEKVISAIGVENIYPNLSIPPSEEVKYYKGAVSQFKNAIIASSYKNSNVIDIALQHTNPQLAAKILNLLVDLFKERHLEILAKPKSSFLEQQMTDYRQKLEKAEDDLEEFKQKYQVYDLVKQRDILLYSRNEFDDRLKTNQHTIEELQERISFLKAQQKLIPENIITSIHTSEGRHSIIDSSKAQLLKLQLEEKELLETYKENNRLVVEKRKQIQTVESFLDAQEDSPADLTMAGNEIYRRVEYDIINTEAQLTSLEAKNSIIQQQFDLYNQELQAIDLTEKQLRNLEREVKNNEDNYKTYLAKYEDAKISEDMDRQKLTNISVIELALVPKAPVSPRVKLNILVGILLGATAGFGFALLTEFYISQGLSTPAQVERVLGIPVLSTIPYKEK